ncbi:hypothetical protein Hanom_Chr03g00189921 [Helianthus anomalus]
MFSVKIHGYKVLFYLYQLLKLIKTYYNIKHFLISRFILVNSRSWTRFYYGMIVYCLLHIGCTRGLVT